MNSKPFDSDALHAKLAYLGLAIDVTLPIVLLAVGYAIRKDQPSALDYPTLRLLWVVLLAIAAGEFAVGLVLRKIWFAPQRFRQAVERAGGRADAVILRYAIALYAVSAAPAVYGFIYYLLGGTIEQFVGFLAITLLCYQILRPRPGLVDPLLKNSLS